MRTAPNTTPPFPLRAAPPPRTQSKEFSIPILRTSKPRRSEGSCGVLVPSVNYTIKCNTLGEKKEFIQICGKIELRNKFYYKGDLYELQTFYHRRTLLSTRILCKGKKLSGNRKTSRQKREFGFQRITEKLYILPRRSEILSVYGAKEKQPSEQLSSPRDVLEARGIGLHR